MGPPDSGRVSRVPPYLGSRQAASRFRVRGSHPLRPAFPDRSPIARRATRRSRNPREQALGFRLLRFRSPLLTQSRLMSSPAGTEMFHFPASRPRDLCVQPRVMGHDPIGLLHSEIPGSQCACHSPRLIAACHVLHRLMVPRHPSCARIRLAEALLAKTKSDLRSVYVAFFPETFICQRSKIRS